MPLSVPITGVHTVLEHLVQSKNIPYYYIGFGLVVILHIVMSLNKLGENLDLLISQPFLSVLMSPDGSCNLSMLVQVSFFYTF